MHETQFSATVPVHGNQVTSERTTTSLSVSYIPSKLSNNRKLALRCKAEIIHNNAINKSKTYSRRDSHVVTHRSTKRPISCLSTRERTGSAVLSCLWPYVLGGVCNVSLARLQCWPGRTPEARLYGAFQLQDLSSSVRIAYVRSNCTVSRSRVLEKMQDSAFSH